MSLFLVKFGIVPPAGEPLQCIKERRTATYVSDIHVYILLYTWMSQSIVW